MAIMTADEIADIRLLLAAVGDYLLRTRTWCLPKNNPSSLDQRVDDMVRNATEMLTHNLKKRYPDDQYVTPDMGVQPKSPTGVSWVLVPLDGRVSFASHSSFWSVGILCFDENAKQALFYGVYFPALNKTVVCGKDIPPELNGEKLKPLSASDDNLIVALEAGPDKENLNFPQVDGQNAWSVLEFDCTTYSLLELAQGNIYGLHIARVNPWIVMGMVYVIQALGGEVKFHSTTDQETGPFSFKAGKSGFMAKMSQILNAPEAADQ